MIDLHAHTWYSDGTLSPADLVQRAVSNGVTHLAITDHDCTGALDEIARIPESRELTVIPGVEISALWQQREVHIIGLFIDPRQPTLETLLRRQQTRRLERIQAFDSRLREIGISGLTDYMLTLPCQAAGRNHVADFLIEAGHAVDKQQAFKKFLGSTGRIKTPVHWCSLEEAVQAIRSAGGVAVVAHPNRYKLTRTKMLAFLEAFQKAGGEGMEVSYSNLSHDQLLALLALCEKQDLWASMGSDFHTPEMAYMDLGRIRQLPADFRHRAIWQHPRWPATAAANCPERLVSGGAGTQSGP